MAFSEKLLESKNLFSAIEGEIAKNENLIPKKFLSEVFWSHIQTHLQNHDIKASTPTRRLSVEAWGQDRS